MPPTPLTIASLPLATNLILAPMSGYCDVSYRLIARRLGGLGLGVTDLLCPEGVLRENRRSMEIAATCPEDSPLAMQLYGGDADLLCDAARWAEDRGAHIVDINMGCPVDKITKRNGGSKLLCDPDNTLRIVHRIKSSLRRTPLTAKLRLGWDDSSIVAPYLAQRLEDLGVAAITVHGRTTAMQFGGQVRLHAIADVVNAVKKIPIIGNGDIKTPHDAAHMLQQTGCQGLMIGRAALSAPWIFRDTWTYLTTGQIPPPPTLEQKCKIMRDHFENILHFRRPRAAVYEFRQRISWYAKQLHPCRMLKDQMRKIETPAHFYQALEDFLTWRNSPTCQQSIATNQLATNN